MASFAALQLSGSTNGRPIPVVQTATAGTLIHTATSSGVDEICLWASNVTGAAATLTLEWGGVTDPGDHLVKGQSIPANSTVQVAFGQRMGGGLLVRAFSGTASAINLTGTVTRIS